MYLFDTNIWLERLLDQDNSAVVGELLDKIPSDQILISDFCFHSLSLILTRHTQFQTLIDFIEDVVIDGGVRLVTCPPKEIARVIDVMNQFRLDFDALRTKHK